MDVCTTTLHLSVSVINVLKHSTLSSESQNNATHLRSALRRVSMDPEGSEALCNAWSFLRGMYPFFWLIVLGMTSELRVVRGPHILRAECNRRRRELAEAKKKNKLAEYLKIRKSEVQTRALVGCLFQVLCRHRFILQII